MKTRTIHSGINSLGTMSTGPAALRIAGIAIAAALVLAGCMNPFGSVFTALRVQEAGAARGSVADVRISVGGYGPQSIIPDVASRIDEYRVTISRDGFDDISLSGAGTSFDFTEVPAGTWMVTVEAVDADGAVIGSGSAEIDVAVGGANSVSVSVAPTTAGTGSVDLTVTWEPPGLIDAVQSATLTPRDGGGAAQDISGDLDLDALATGRIGYQATLDAGVYRLEIRFARDGLFVAVVMEAIHIYDNVVTSGSIDLTADQVGQPPAAPDTLSAAAAGGAIHLSWADVSPVNDHYEIQWRLQGDADWQDLDTIEGSVSSYSHDIADVGNFEHRIRATNAFGPTAAEEGWVAFPIVSTGDFPSAPAPTIVPPSTPYVNGTRWRITSAVPGATIYYTTNGVDPTTSSAVFDPANPIVLTTGDGGPTDYTIKAFVVAPGYNPGSIASESVTIMPGRMVTQFNDDVSFAQSNTPNSLRAMIRDAYNDSIDGLTFTWHEDYTDADIINQFGNPGTFEIGMRIRTTVTVDGGNLDIWNFGYSGYRHFIVENGGRLILRNINFSGNEIYGLNLRGGNGLGGVILVESGGTLELENVTFRQAANGIATGGGTDQINASGGAIGNDGGTVIVRDSVFYGGVANRGGGAIANVSGTTTVEDSWFVGHRLNNYATISGTTLQNGGGAIAVYGGTVTVSDSVFYANTTENTTGTIDDEFSQGGAIAVFNDGNLYVQGSHFIENVGQDGSAIYVGTGELTGDSDEPDATGTVRIGSSVFYRNAGRSSRAGAIYVHWGMGPPYYDIEVHTSTFVENTRECEWNFFGEDCGVTYYAAITHPRDYDDVAYWYNSLFVNNDVTSASIDAGFATQDMDAGDNDSSGDLAVSDPATVFAAPPDLPPLTDLTFDTLPMDGGSNDFSVLEGLEGDFAVLEGSSIAASVVDQGNNAHLMEDYADLDGDGNTTERQSLDLQGRDRVQGSSIDRGAVEGSEIFVAPPSFNPPPGRYSAGFDLEITASGAAAIYYTLDGSDPDPTDLAGPTEVYTGPITIDPPLSFTIRARAEGPAGNLTGISEGVYGGPTVLTVTTDAASGAGSLAEALGSALEGDTIVFDGDYTITAPSSLSSPPDWFTVSESVTIDAGGNAVVLDANQAGRHFLVDASATLTLRADAGGSLTLQNGRGVDTNGIDSVAGGSVYVDGGTLVTENVDFLNNRTADQAPSGNQAGGAVYVHDGAARIAGGVFEGNISDTWGGAVGTRNGGNTIVEVTGTTFLNNTAGEDTSGSAYGGGAINIAGSTTATVRNAHFEGNQAGLSTSSTSADGGAIRNAGVLRLSGSTFQRNRANTTGGAVETGRQGKTSHITTSFFHGNSAGTDGGAIRTVDGRLTASSSVFVGNVAEGGNGGAISAEGSDTIVGSTLVSNEAPTGSGSGLYTASDENTAVNNSIFWDNDLAGPYSAANTTLPTDSDPLFASLPDPGSGGWGDGDPAEDYGDLHLQTSPTVSPAIDAGDDASVPADATDLDEDRDTGEAEPSDIIGGARVLGTAVDRGAYEVQ